MEYATLQGARVKIEIQTGVEWNRAVVYIDTARSYDISTTFGREHVVETVIVAVICDHFADVPHRAVADGKRGGVSKLDVAHAGVDAVACHGSDCPCVDVHMQHRRHTLLLGYVRTHRRAAHRTVSRWGTNLSSG